MKSLDVIEALFKRVKAKSYIANYEKSRGGAAKKKTAPKKKSAAKKSAAKKKAAKKRTK